MSGVRILQFLKDEWKFIQIQKYYTMALKECMFQQKNQIIFNMLTHWKQFDFAITHISHTPQPEYTRD